MVLPDLFELSGWKTTLELNFRGHIIINYMKNNYTVLNCGKCECCYMLSSNDLLHVGENKHTNRCLLD